MLNKIKSIFGFGGVQKVVSPAVEVKETVEEKVLDISEPIYTIVEKIKENPKRIVFTTRFSEFNGLYVCFLDKITGTTGVIREPRCFNGELSKVVMCDQFHIKKDESDYILKHLWGLYEDRHTRLTKLKQLRKERNEMCIEKRARVQMLKAWEES